MSKNYATYNSLMKHLRNDRQIQIGGSHEKNDLLRVGYYHGYKGYRFYRESDKAVAFSRFSEIKNVINFDESLKTILYQPIMQLETAIKNYICEQLIAESKSSNFSDVFNECFENKKKRYEARDKVYSALTSRYGSSKIVKHYYQKDIPIPIWAILEELMLGDLSLIIEALKPSVRLKISDIFGVPKVHNTDGALLPNIIREIKDLRNAIAHNKIVYDGRYMTFNQPVSYKKFLRDVSSIPTIKMDCILDDVALLCWLMYRMHFPKKQIQRMVIQIKDATALLQKELNNELFQSVAGKIEERLPSIERFVKTLK